MAASPAVVPSGRDPRSRLAGMDVHALMAPTRDQLPVQTTATVVAVGPAIANEVVGSAYVLMLTVDATADSSTFKARSAVLSSTMVPSVGDRLVVSFRLERAHDVATVGRVTDHPSQR